MAVFIQFPAIIALLTAEYKCTPVPSLLLVPLVHLIQRSPLLPVICFASVIMACFGRREVGVRMNGVELSVGAR